MTRRRGRLWKVETAYMRLLVIDLARNPAPVSFAITEWDCRVRPVLAVQPCCTRGDLHLGFH